MVRRPAIAPLFPYTTLFRSARTRDGDFLDRRRQLLSMFHASGIGAVVRLLVPLRPIEELTEPLEQPIVDRKSTRLNSSHMSISYAVFCLKNKKMEEVAGGSG